MGRIAYHSIITSLIVCTRLPLNDTGHTERNREREGKTGKYKQRLESAVYQRDTGKTPKYHFLEAQKNETQENNMCTKVNM